MNYIKAVIGGKSVGIADGVCIEPAVGCKNKCIGCYGKKSSMRGKNYDNVVCKVLDKEILKKSIRLVKSKGFQLARIGKHCDPGNHIDMLNGILECCNDESFRCVCVSKTLEYNSETSLKLITGNHILHISLGPYSSTISNEEDRLIVAEKYSASGVYTCVRLTRDITQPINDIDKYVMNNFTYIITPMRYSSKEILNFYCAKKENFDFKNGYYRPNYVHPTWEDNLENICGEINGLPYCCNCLVGDII